MDEDYINNYVKNMAETRGLNPQALEGYRKMMVGDIVQGPRRQIAAQWMAKQVYIAMGFLMETAAILKIDCCPMEGIQPEKYDEVLGLQKTNYTSVASVALGYRSPEDQLQFAKKVRFNTSEVFEFV
jgi:nitroreductase